jgi:hypothetical protein
MTATTIQKLRSSAVIAKSIVLADTLNKAADELAAYAAAALDHTAMPPMTEDLVEILGRPNFTCIRPAQAMRMGGIEIPSKAEYEQAHFIHFLLGQYFLHGADWAKKSNEALQAMMASAKPVFGVAQQGGADD